MLPEHPPAVPELESRSYSLRDPVLDPSDGVRGQVAEVVAEFEEQGIRGGSVGREEYRSMEEVLGHYRPDEGRDHEQEAPQGRSPQRDP